jgi:arginyl-tRNA synthetase
MLASQRAQIAGFLRSALQQVALSANKSLSEADLLSIADALEKPRQAEHGDIASNIALRLAKSLGMPPAKIAQALATTLVGLPGVADVIQDVDVAGPGFINFRLTPAARAAVLADIAHAPDQFGITPIPPDAPSVVIEFVSANPTGPLHVGHGRQAALGDTLAAMLAATGVKVSREFYYNDAGAQINIAEIAQAYCEKSTTKAVDGEAVTSDGNLDDLDAIRRFAVSYLRHEQDLDLRAFGVAFDRYYLESSLYADGRVEQTVQDLIKSSHTYEQEGALWLRTTDFGDDKDRVMRKSDGGYTYFVPDVAYHVTKWERGFRQAINIQGSDHHGTIARVRAGLQALNIGIPKGFPDYVLHKMVTVMRGGEEVKISKRAGSYVTLRDLISWSGEFSDADGKPTAVDEQRGRDAVRFFLASRKADSEFVFDVDLALSRSEDNPVYYVQYAHARICSVLLQAQTDMSAALARGLAGHQQLVNQLVAPREQQLLNRLSDFPDVIGACAAELSPHLMAFYLRDLAADFHGFYNSERVLVDDPELRTARLFLLAAAGAVLRQGLGLLGVSAPTRM